LTATRPHPHLKGISYDIMDFRVEIIINIYDSLQTLVDTLTESFNASVIKLIQNDSNIVMTTMLESEFNAVARKHNPTSEVWKMEMF